MKNLAIFGIVLFLLFPLIIYFIMSNPPSSSKNDTVKVENVLSETNVVIETTKGDLHIDLFVNEAPETVKNFLALASEGKYDNVPFHRVIKDFMIQTGDFENKDGTGGHTYNGPDTTLPDEFAEGLTHKKGTLAMANRGPNTGASQFYIVHAEETSWLDGKHTIFGQLTEGFEVLDEIANTETDMSDRPVEEVLILSVKQ